MPPSTNSKRRFTMTDEYNSLGSCVVMFFVMLILLVFVVILAILVSSAMSSYGHLVILLDRHYFDVALICITIFIVLVSVSLLFETLLWCSRYTSLCAYRFVLTMRILVWLGSIVLVILYMVFLSKFLNREAVRSHLKGSLEGYRGEYETDVYSYAWNRIMVEYGTCGVDGPQDWNVTQWRRITKDVPEIKPKREVPLTCCVNMDSYYFISEHRFSGYAYENLKIKKYPRGFIERCTDPDRNKDKKTSLVNNKGSFEYIYAELLSKVVNNAGILAIMVLILIFQFVLLIVTCMVYVTYKEALKEDAERNRILG